MAWRAGRLIGNGGIGERLKLVQTATPTNSLNCIAHADGDWTNERKRYKR
jgi:hypothetical protein